MTTTLPTLEEMMTAEELANIKSNISSKAVDLFAAEVFPRLIEISGYKGTATPTADVILTATLEGEKVIINNTVNIGVDFGASAFDPYETAQRMIFVEGLKHIMEKNR